MILHIPHSSVEIPEQFRDQIVLSDSDLDAELILMTDLYTDEIYDHSEATIIYFPMSRLIVDVERFPEDDDEPMSKIGMGMIYKKTAYGKKLRRNLQDSEISKLKSHYDRHHKNLLKAVELELTKYDTSVIVDCHSFPSQPLPCDMDQSILRPQICIGTDSFHTPIELLQVVEYHFKKNDYDVQINRPYGGALVPMEFYKKEGRVISIMIEINRSLYIDEKTGEKRDTFEAVKKHIKMVLDSIQAFQEMKESIPSSPNQMLIEIYKNTLFTYVCSSKVHEIKVGVFNQELCFKLKNTSGAVYITAWNPYGVELSIEKNKQSNENLLRVLKDYTQEIYRGEGKSECGDWKEDSFLALNISKEKALDLSVQFSQNAVVYIPINGVPELIINPSLPE